jgi:hypothetical protein
VTTLSPNAIVTWSRVIFAAAMARAPGRS